MQKLQKTVKAYEIISKTCIMLNMKLKRNGRIANYNKKSQIKKDARSEEKHTHKFVTFKTFLAETRNKPHS